MLLAPVRREGSATSGARILLVSDPIYELSDPRLHLERARATGNASDYPPNPLYRRIPGTAREASAIEAQFPAPDVDTLSGLQATRDRLLQLDWSRYRFIHIASHGYSDARMPQLSALILSAYDERGERIADALRAADLSSLTLNAEVAVFSGCDTALGKEVLNEGMVGISYATSCRFIDIHPRHCRDRYSDHRAQRGPGARALRRRIKLGRGDSTIAGRGTECHRRAKPSDDAA
jgi:hypothetical protein